MNYDFYEWAGEKLTILAQASNSCLSESRKNSPQSLLKLLLRRGVSVLNEEQSCSSEKVAKNSQCHYSSSRSGENTSIAWARAFNLNETGAWMRFIILFLLYKLFYFCIMFCLYYEIFWTEIDVLGMKWEWMCQNMYMIWVWRNSMSLLADFMVVFIGYLMK